MKYRHKFGTQFLRQQRTTCGQEASKIWINKTFISVEIQTIYKSVLIYQILGSQECTLGQNVSKQPLLPGRNKNSISRTGSWNSQS